MRHEVHIANRASLPSNATNAPVVASFDEVRVLSASLPTPSTTTRTVSYTYDGLQRLTGATESTGTTYGYAYDKAGNRTEVTLNGTVTESQSYNAANQVVGWTYDAAGNLLHDGTQTLTYDAFNRVMTVNGTQRAYRYNGDGVLVGQTTPTGIISFTQDLQAPLSQILQTVQSSGTTTTYLYGAQRLAAVQGSTRSWYVGDALGSVRQVLDGIGQPLMGQNYDPWGTPTGGVVPEAFGFMGEWQDSATGLVNLRARWYQPRAGRFLTRDPFEGIPERPQTLAKYLYVENNPINMVDPSGKLGIFVAGGFPPRAETGSSRPGIWDMSDHFAPIIKGHTYHLNPDSQVDIFRKVEDIFEGTALCPSPNALSEPIVLIGHSRGAGAIQSAVYALNHFYPDRKIDLVVTLGMIPIPQQFIVPNTSPQTAAPNVVSHINLMSEVGELFGESAGWGPNEEVVSGAEVNVVIEGTTHATIDDQFLDARKTSPNPVWSIVRAAILRTNGRR